MSARKGQVYKKRRPYEVVVCEHCGAECKGNIFFRWHGDKCKNKPAASFKDYIEGEEDDKH